MKQRKRGRSQIFFSLGLDLEVERLKIRGLEGGSKFALQIIDNLGSEKRKLPLRIAKKPLNLIGF